MSKETIYKLKLDKGIQINQDQLRQVVEEEEYIQAKTTAFNISGRSMQSEHMLRMKLDRKGYQQRIIDRVIDLLKRYNMIDDKELARMMIKDKINLNRYGKNRIKQDLYKKGIDSEIVDEMLSLYITDGQEYENALYHGQKKLKLIKHEERNKMYQKLARHLVYKGFNYDIVNKVIQQLIKDAKEEY